MLAIASSVEKSLAISFGGTVMTRVAACGRRLLPSSHCGTVVCLPFRKMSEHRELEPHKQEPEQRIHRIILCRHGLSAGNIDASSYVHTADWKIPLSKEGKAQAAATGNRLATIIKGEKCFVYYSPYHRAKDTMQEILAQLPTDTVIGARPEPRIVEQQFGNFQNYEEVQNSRDERVKFGRFFYRFPSGEAGLDVYNRVTSFISTLFRDAKQMRDSGVDMSKTNFIIVTHGLTLRLFLMRWLQIDVEEFEDMYNPDNGFLAVMECKTDPKTGHQWYELTKETADHLRIKTRQTRSPLFL